jgi:trans-2,3-dihydro-3-hydroxyanthranilate isomerase
MVDVFAETAYTGNPLPVILDEGELSDCAMQRIASELNHSETAFVNPLPDADGGYPTRLFTPAREIAFAGHPILGAARVVRDHVADAGLRSVRLKLAEAAVEVTFEASARGDEIAWFRAPPISPGAVLAPAQIAPAVGLSVADIATDTPVQVMSAGTSAVIVPLRDRDALERCRLDLDAFAPLAASGVPPLTYLFCREPQEGGDDYRVRFFFEAHGVREDAATGNGAAFFGAYLLAHRRLPQPPRTLRIAQGHALRRPSRVMLRVSEGSGAADIRVGGQVIPLIEGRLL